MISALMYEDRIMGYRISGIYGKYDFYADSRWLVVDEDISVDNIIHLQRDSKNRLRSDDEGSEIPVKDISNNLERYELQLKMEGISIDRRVSKRFDVFYGKSLLNRIDTVDKLNRRWYVDELYDCYMNGEKQVTELLGVRRTGKTVSMLHIVSKMLENNIPLEEIIFMEIHKESFLTGNNLLHMINSLNKWGVKYIFIDEITFLKDALDDLAVFDESWTFPRIMLTGTDSGMFLIFNSVKFFDRAQIIRSTYISYKEFNFLYPTASFLDYMREGGLLYSDTRYRNSHEWVYKNENLISKGREYLSSSLCDNMLNTFDKCGYISKYDVLSDVVLKYGTGSVKKILLNLAQYLTLRDMYENMMKDFIFVDLHRALDLDRRMKRSMIDLENAIEAEFNDKLRIKEIWYRNIEDDRYRRKLIDDVVSNFRDFLTDIDCLITIDNGVRGMEYLWPFSVRYVLVHDVINLLKIKNEKGENDTGGRAKDLKDKIIGVAEGEIIEEMIRINLAKGGIESSKYRNSGTGCEVDIVTDEALIEVKRSDKAVDAQARWLVSQEIQNDRRYTGKKRIILTNTEEETIRIISEYAILLDKVNMLRESNKAITRELQKSLEEASHERIEVQWRNISRYLIENTYREGIPSFRKY